MKKLMLFSLVLCLGLFACKKDTNGDVVITPDPTANYVTATVNGIVIDEDGMVVPNAMVSLSGTNTFKTTDGNGYFSITSSNVNDEGAFLKVEKIGYFLGSRTFIPHNGKARVRVMLMAANHVGSVSKSAGGSVMTNGGATVELPANAVVLKSGGAYTGTMVNVAAKWLDPSSNTTGLTMPGDLRAEDEAGTTRVLSSAGMMAVELTGDAGEALQLADGKSATLNFPLTSELEVSAPATIPLWSFDEEAGIWKEEGEAIKQGDRYVGTVSHFSFWNCDVTSNPITLTVLVKTTEGDLVSHAMVTLNYDGLLSGTGITNDEGITSGYIPTDQVLEINIAAHHYCSPAYTQSIGPFTADETITIVINPIETTAISGNLINCSGEAVTNGYVLITNLDGIVRTLIEIDDTGHFSNTHIVCPGESIYVNGYDIDALAKSDNITIPDNSTDNNLGEILVCETLESYLNISINGELIASPDAMTYDSTDLTYHFIYTNSAYTFDFISEQTIGTYDVNNFHFGDYATWNVSMNTLQTTVTEMNEDYIGGTIQGTFTSLLDTTNVVECIITGSYRAERHD